MNESNYGELPSHYDSGETETGWPGDGSGADDLADYNTSQGDHYHDESESPVESGGEDEHLESEFEARTECEGY